MDIIARGCLNYKLSLVMRKPVFAVPHMQKAVFFHNEAQLGLVHVKGSCLGACCCCTWSFTVYQELGAILSHVTDNHCSFDLFDFMLYVYGKQLRSFGVFLKRGSISKLLLAKPTRYRPSYHARSPLFLNKLMRKNGH